jgi:capsule polysaccharide export protein KpsE/RkpR
MNELEEKGKSLNLIDFVLIVLKWKRFILITTACITIVSIILFFFVFPLIYYSSAIIKGSGKAGGFFSAIEQLSNFSSLEDLSLGSKSKELATYSEILTSRRCLEPLILKYDLMNRDDYMYMEDAVKGFAKQQLSLDEDKIAGTLSIGVYDKDPLVAKDMTEFLIEQLDKINIELSITQAKNNRQFIETRYLQAKEDLKNAEDSLRAFQMIYGVAPDLQIKASAQSAFTLEAEIKTEEVKLEVLKKVLSPDQIEVKTQEATINALKEQLSSVKNSTDLNDLLRLGNSPQIVMSYLRLQRDIEIQTKILTFLLPVYEQAKIEEKRETPTIIILEKPYIAERKSKPKRLTMVIFSLLGSLTILSIGTILYETSYRRLINSIKEGR